MSVAEGEDTCIVMTSIFDCIATTAVQTVVILASTVAAAFVFGCQ